ncbi:MAG: hypothetical protein P4N24_18835 [Acidobacteriota bacterium]|nr:hypothetical protein [Acidobacteriota bacterium]
MVENEAVTSPPLQPEDRLDGWGKIAAFLGRGVRTVQRWEKEGALPVRRLFKHRRSLVHAYHDELKLWLRARGNQPYGLSPPPSVSPLAADAGSGTRREVLTGWKEIAAFLGRSVNTAQRWEKDIGLPVRRLKSKGRSVPFILRHKLMAWLEESGIVAGSNAEGVVSPKPPPILQALFDGYGAEIAILDSRGTVIAVNKAWKESGLSHGDRHPRFGLGRNYLEVCWSTGGGGVDPSLALEKGIIEVLNGTRGEFLAKYSHGSPEKREWFALHLTRFTFRGTTLVVAAHNRITGLLAD